MWFTQNGQKIQSTVTMLDMEWKDSNIRAAHMKVNDVEIWQFEQLNQSIC